MFRSRYADRRTQLLSRLGGLCLCISVPPRLGSPPNPADTRLRLGLDLYSRGIAEGFASSDGNWTWDCFLAFAWQGAGDERLVVTVNYAPNQSQCHVRLPFADLGDSRWRLKDLLGDAAYDWAGNDLRGRGLYLDESPWKASVFSLTNVQGG